MIMVFKHMCSEFVLIGISYSTDEPSLREAFSRYGEVLDGE